MAYKKNTSMLPIDEKKLKPLINQTGYGITAVSKMVHKAKSYLSECCNKGRIQAGVAELLQIKFGIAYDDYKPDPMYPVQEPAEVTKVPEVTSWDGLSEIIQSSIQSSIWSVFRDHREELEDMMTSAFKKGIRRVNRDDDVVCGRIPGV